MPKKRRKAVASFGTPDIPYPKVRVEWIDCVSDSGWATDREFDKMRLARPINEGWLYSKDDKSIKLFAHFCQNCKLLTQFEAKFDTLATPCRHPADTLSMLDYPMKQCPLPYF